MFYNPMHCIPCPSDWVLILTSDHLWIARLIELLSDDILCFRKFLWLLPLTHDAIGKLCLLPLISCTIWFVSHALQACVNYSWSVWYMFLRCPYGLNLYLTKSIWPGEFSRVLLFWCYAGYSFKAATWSKARNKWQVMHWWSGSRPWTLCSCPWKRRWSYHRNFS